MLFSDILKHEIHIWKLDQWHKWQRACLILSPAQHATQGPHATRIDLSGPLSSAKSATRNNEKWVRDTVQGSRVCLMRESLGSILSLHETWKTLISSQAPGQISDPYFLQSSPSISSIALSFCEVTVCSLVLCVSHTKLGLLH